MENPLIIDADYTDLNNVRKTHDIQDIIGVVKGSGFENFPELFYDYTDEEINDFDGIIIQNVIDDIGPKSQKYQDVHIAIEPNQIKSVDAESFCHETNINKSIIQTILNKAGFDPNQERDSSGKWGSGELTEDEKNALYNYSEYEYEDINNCLRGKNCKEGIKKTIEDIKNGLEKLPPYDGISYRAADFNRWWKKEDFIKDLESDWVFNADTFLSTSTTNYYGDQGSDVNFIISGFSGKSIKDYAYAPDENEVLFNVLTRFDVERWEEDNNGIITVYLNEL